MYTYVNLRTINRKRDHKLERARKGIWEVLEDKNKRRQFMYLQYNFKK